MQYSTSEPSIDRQSLTAFSKHRHPSSTGIKKGGIMPP